MIIHKQYPKLLSDLRIWHFYFHCLLSPSNSPESPCILSICLDNSSLLLNFDAQYGHETWVLSLIVTISLCVQINSFVYSHITSLLYNIQEIGYQNEAYYLMLFIKRYQIIIRFYYPLY